MKKQYIKTHGSPYDRGSADAYYRRLRKPHWYVKGAGNSPEIGVEQMTEEEIEAYNAGYDAIQIKPL